MTTDQGTAGGAELQLSTLVTPTSQGLNPNANVFQSKLPNTPSTFSIVPYDECFESIPSTPVTPVSSADAGYRYINGDLAKLSLDGTPVVTLPSVPHTTPDATCGPLSSPPPPPSSDYPVNGLQVTLPAATPVVVAAAAINPEAVCFQSVAAGTASSSVEATMALATSSGPAPPHDGQGDGDGSDLEGEALPMDQLKSLLTQQLEYYFSRENLANDTYLLSQMDSDQYVPIWTVANFNQIKKLTKDLNLIIDVLRESPNVQVDDAGEKVRPNHKRCIVILREIPDCTPLEEVENLFKGESCPKFASCEFAHNNSWYVTFESDDDAQRAYRYLREEVKTFQGKSILARIKAKPFARTTFVPKNGYRPLVEMNVYQQPHQIQSQQQQQQPQQQPAVQQQQPQPSHQQQQRYMAYNPTPVPSIGYNSQVPVYAFPPFYPPNLLQTTWAPPNQACYDIASVFSINGLSPQAAYKPMNGTGRTSYPARATTHPKCHPRSHRLLSADGRTESRPPLHHAHHHGYHSHHQHHHHSSLLGAASGNACSYGAPQSSRGAATSRSTSMDNLLAKWEVRGSATEGATGTLLHHHNHHRHIHHQQHHHAAAAGGGGGGGLPRSTPGYSQLPATVTPPHAVSGVSVAVGSDRREDTTTQTLASALLFRHADDQHSPLGGLPPRVRVRRRRKDEDVVSTRSYQERSKSPVLTKEMKSLPKFDLEESSFPPLPGTVDASGSGSTIDTEDVFENRMADVVKGTAKPSTRDTKTQTSAPLSPVSLLPASSSAHSATTTKESSTLTNGDALISVFTPPTSPSPPISRSRNVTTADKATRTDETLANSGDEQQGKQSAAEHRTTTAGPTTTASSSSSSAAPPSAFRLTATPRTPAAPASTAVARVVNGVVPEAAVTSWPQSATQSTDAVAASTPLVATNKVAPTNSISDTAPVRLSYAHVAQRAKEKVEKLAQEQKEKQETQERERRVKERELATVTTFNPNFNPNFNTNFNPKSIGGPQRGATAKDGRPAQRDSLVKAGQRDKTFERDRFRKFRAPQKENEFCGDEERWREQELEAPSSSSPN